MRSREVRRLNREAAVHKVGPMLYEQVFLKKIHLNMQNFYGTKANPFFPHSFEISYDKTHEEQELLLAKVGAEALPESCLPYGMKMDDHRTMVVAAFFGYLSFSFCELFRWFPWTLLPT